MLEPAIVGMKKRELTESVTDRKCQPDYQTVSICPHLDHITLLHPFANFNETLMCTKTDSWHGKK